MQHPWYQIHHTKYQKIIPNLQYQYGEVRSASQGGKDGWQVESLARAVHRELVKDLMVSRIIIIFLEYHILIIFFQKNNSLTSP